MTRIQFPWGLTPIWVSMTRGHFICPDSQNLEQNPPQNGCLSNIFTDWLYGCIIIIITEDVNECVIKNGCTKCSCPFLKCARVSFSSLFGFVLKEESSLANFFSSKADYAFSQDFVNITFSPQSPAQQKCLPCLAHKKLSSQELIVVHQRIV